MLGLKLTRHKSKEGAFMINSIQHFQEQGVKNLTEIFSHYTDDLTKFAEMVYGVTKEVTKLGLFNVTLFFKILQRNMVFICIDIQTAYSAFLLQRLQ